jgi:hypothetical protein
VSDWKWIVYGKRGINTYFPRVFDRENEEGAKRHRERMERTMETMTACQTRDMSDEDLLQDPGWSVTKVRVIYETEDKA